MAIALRWTLRDLIVPFVALTLCLVAYGMVSLVRAMVEAILGVVASAIGGIPLVGRLGKSAIHSAENAISSALGAAAAGLEGQMGRFWHALATEVTQIGEALFLIAQALNHVIETQINPWVIDHLESLIYGQQQALRNLRAQTLHLPAYTIPRTKAPARPGEHANAKAVGAGAAALPNAIDVAIPNLRQRVGAQSAALDGVIEWDLPRLRARDRALSDRLERAWRWIRAHGKSIGEIAGVGAVAIALARLGFKWLTCRNVGRVGRQVCATDADILDQLLLDGLAIFGVLSVVEFARVMVELEDDAIALIGTMVREWP